MEKTRTNQSAFSTTFQGQSQEETPKQKECLCGEQHLFRDCPYLVQERQPVGCKPNPAIQEQIKAKMKNPKIKYAVNRARASKKEQQPQQKTEEKKEEKETPKPVEETYDNATFAISTF